jgi:hypothetical protein
MSDDLITTDIPLSKDERQTLEILVGMMVPASEKYQVPGADDAQIFARILATPNDTLAAATSDLAALDQASMDQHGARFPALNDDKRMPLLMEFSMTHPLLIPTLVGITMNCYYQDDRVLASLNMEARPPYPEGFIVEQGDWSLLEPVQQRPKMYREDS